MDVYWWICLLLVLLNKTKSLLSHFLKPSKIFTTNLAICCSNESYFFQVYEQLYNRTCPELKFKVIKMRKLSMCNRHIHLQLILNTLCVKGHHTYVMLADNLRGKENTSYFLKPYQSNRNSLNH